jgi:hypothetical protein
MNLSPLRGFAFSYAVTGRGLMDSALAPFLGLTPQAMSLSPLRGWIALAKKRCRLRQIAARR